MSAPDPRAVQRELDRLLGSPAFKGSKRSREFLQHVIDTALRGESETLKERTIGVALFHRAADYDTSQDSIVRVKANEVRRRLAQAYRELGPAPEVEILIPTGSYAPEFRPVAQAAVSDSSSIPAAAGRRGIWWWAASAALLVTCFAAVAAWRAARAPLRVFWRPLLAANGTVVICVPHPPEFGASNAASPAAVSATAPVNANAYVAVGDMVAASRLAAHLAAMGKPYRILHDNDTASIEQGAFPVIFAGAFPRQLQTQLNGALRFVLQAEDGETSIRETAGERRRWRSSSHSTRTCYALLTRVFQGRSRRPVISAAGVGLHGTEAAAEFLTDEAALRAVVRQLPADWAGKNFQVVLQVEAKPDSAGPPRLAASHVW
jgi:hypothetical protein